MNRQALIAYISDTYGVQEEHLWARFPDFAVFRNPRNRKWFAILMNIDRQKLGLSGAGKTDVINLKCDFLMMGSLLNADGYLPAYHMSKKSWLTAVLDAAPEDELLSLLEDLGS